MTHFLLNAGLLSAATVGLSFLSNLTPVAAVLRQPTSTGSALVQFTDSLPASLEVGGTLAGYTVTDLIPQVNTAIVDAHDLSFLKEDLAGSLLGGDVHGVFDNARVYALGDEPLTPGDLQSTSQFGPALHNLPEAWGLAGGYGSPDIVVVVADTGIRSTHDDLKRLSFANDYDFVDNDLVAQDGQGHGTHVAGTVGATTDNGKGVVGMTQANVWSYRVSAVLHCFLLGWSSLSLLIT